MLDWGHCQPALGTYSPMLSYCSLGGPSQQPKYMHVSCQCVLSAHSKSPIFIPSRLLVSQTSFTIFHRLYWYHSCSKLSSKSICTTALFDPSLSGLSPAPPNI